jgi:hypothetical protein
MRKITVANGAVFPDEQQTHEYTNDEIPPNYAVVHVLWFHDDYEQYEIDFPTKEGIKFLGVALDHDVLWNKDDIEVIPPTSMATQTLGSQPSVVGPSPPHSDDGDGDDKGNESTRRPSPPPGHDKMSENTPPPLVKSAEKSPQVEMKTPPPLEKSAEKSP